MDSSVPDATGYSGEERERTIDRLVDAFERGSMEGTQAIARQAARVPVIPERQFADDLRVLLADAKSRGDVGMPLPVFFERLLGAFERLASAKDAAAKSGKSFRC